MNESYHKFTQPNNEQQNNEQHVNIKQELNYDGIPSMKPYFKYLLEN